MYNFCMWSSVQLHSERIMTISMDMNKIRLSHGDDVIKGRRQLAAASQSKKIQLCGYYQFNPISSWLMLYLFLAVWSFDSLYVARWSPQTVHVVSFWFVPNFALLCRKCQDLLQDTCGQNLPLFCSKIYAWSLLMCSINSDISEAPNPILFCLQI